MTAMTTTRAVSARKWTRLLLALTVLGAGLAKARMAPPAMPQNQTVWRVQAESDGGGEAGTVAGEDAGTAHLVRLAIVEGHLIAAEALYAKGITDEAISLSYHPEAEMMEGGAAATEPHSTLLAFQPTVDGAINTEARDAKTRFVVAVAVLTAAAAE